MQNFEESENKRILSLQRLNESAVVILARYKYITIELLQQYLNIGFRFAVEIIANLEYMELIKRDDDFNLNGMWIMN